ncbi:hypothetical protein ACFJIW_17375 [Tahibacter sp. UC22_41]|uniref:hypothetical protein n=1 Tax=Tahibacter sp. UC22_41 TaxID=3350178 RepID=UPI0036DC3138
MLRKNLAIDAEIGRLVVNFHNLYEPPSSTVAAEKSSTKNSRGTAMGASLKAALGSILAAALGLSAGWLGAALYTRRYHPDDPDPVDFTIGAVFFLIWVGIWLTGTVLAAWLAFRMRGANTA